jgi:excisionase family DNA binding protein
MQKQPEAVLDSGVELRAYSPSQFAAALHLHIETVRAALREGRLTGFRVGSHWRISHAVLAAVMQRGLPSKPSAAK